MSIEIKKTIALDMSIGDWDLFMPQNESEWVATQFAADQINRAIENAFNGGMDRSEAYRAIYAVMKLYAEMGAIDTEPQCVLGGILN